MSGTNRRLEISYKTIIFGVVFVGLFSALIHLLGQISDILFMIFFSFVAASGLRTSVDRLERLRIPRMLSILIVYLLMFFLIGLVISFVFPPLVNETVRMVRELGSFFSFLGSYLAISPEQITDQIAPIGRNIFNITVGLISNIISIFTFFIFTFYLLLERRHMRVFLKNFLGEDIKEKIVNIVLQMESRLGYWLRAQVALGVIIGVLSYFGLRFLQIDFALPLAIVAGILEVIPIIGPLISAVPAVLVALGVSPWLALSVAALYFIIQQLENNFIVPLVMRQAVGIPPIVSILGILIGGRIAGMAGVILAIPILVCSQVVLREILNLKEENS